jgi:DNA-directed RNA polymerase subunit RPC12/RpoP
MKLPKRTIYYKTGFMMVNREDDPTFQCTSCYKVFFKEDVIVNNAMADIECPHCSSRLRRITDEQPIIT